MAGQALLPGPVLGNREPAQVCLGLGQSHSRAGIGHDAAQEVGQVVVLMVHWSFPGLWFATAVWCVR